MATQRKKLVSSSATDVLDRLRSQLSEKDRMLSELKQEVSTLRQLERQYQRDTDNNHNGEDALQSLVKVMRQETASLNVV